MAFLSSFWLVVGLGNPGPRYVGTRHNMGFMAADYIARENDMSFTSHKGIAMIAKGVLRRGDESAKFFLAKPLTYMNLSGQAVASLSEYYDISPERIIVAHDDMDLAFGRIKVKKGGSPGGHNGLRSIDRSLGTADYYRVRMGMGRPGKAKDQRQKDINWVLGTFDPARQEELNEVCARTSEAVSSLIFDGLTATQEKFNSR